MKKTENISKNVIAEKMTLYFKFIKNTDVKLPISLNCNNSRYIPVAIDEITNNNNTMKK